MNAKRDSRDDLQQRLVAYLDGELEEGDAEEVERQMIKDVEVRSEVDNLQRAWDMLNVLPMPKTKAEFSRRTVDLATRSLIQPGVDGAKRPMSAFFKGMWLGGLLGAFALGGVIVFTQPTVDRRILQDRELLENLPTYQAIGDVEFLQKLEDEKLLDQMDELLEPRS